MKCLIVQINLPCNYKYASYSMGRMFLEGKLATLLKSKAKIVHKLCTMTEEFKTLEVFNVVDECHITEPDESSESDID